MTDRIILLGEKSLRLLTWRKVSPTTNLEKSLSDYSWRKLSPTTTILVFHEITINFIQPNYSIFNIVGNVISQMNSPRK